MALEKVRWRDGWRGAGVQEAKYLQPGRDGGSASNLRWNLRDWFYSSVLAQPTKCDQGSDGSAEEKVSKFGEGILACDMLWSLKIEELIRRWKETRG
jgi:hypothetical protein